MDSHKKFRTIWEFQVRDECIAQFKEVYAADGDWAKLFSMIPGYLATELIQDCDHQSRFVTIDYWESREDFLNLRRKVGPQYRDLDIRTEQFTVSERHLGYFTEI